MNDCIFCKIISGTLPTEKIFENETCVAFRDIHPKAPVHVLVVPKRHIPSLAEVEDGDALLLAQLFLSVRDVAKMVGVSEQGYKTVVNTRAHGGQVVPHLHIHILGGELIRWQV